MQSSIKAQLCTIGGGICAGLILYLNGLKIYDVINQHNISFSILTSLNWGSPIGVNLLHSSSMLICGLLVLYGSIRV